jgi:hypothetical protein
VSESNRDLKTFLTIRREAFSDDPAMLQFIDGMLRHLETPPPVEGERKPVSTETRRRIEEYDPDYFKPSSGADVADAIAWLERLREQAHEWGDHAAQQHANAAIEALRAASRGR